MVSLRPWAGRRGRLPAAVRARVASPPEPLLAATAAALDEAATRTGLAVHLVALQADRDGPLHEQVARRMRTPATLATPGVHGLVDEVATGRAVVSMRYHGGIAAALAGRPAVLVGYSPKVDSLAADLGDAARLLPWRAEGPAGLADAVAGVLGRVPATEALLARGRGNDEVIDALLAAARAGPRRT